MKKLTLSIIAAVFTIGLFAQEFEVPQDYKLELAEDYAPYEQDVIDCVEWLIKAPIDKHEVKRQQANAFLLKWITGSPNVMIEIKPEVVTFMETTPDLLMIFLGGWAKYSLETKDFDNKVAGNLAGVEAVMKFYENNKGTLPRDKNVEKYIKMKEKGTLKEYIEKNA